MLGNASKLLLITTFFLLANFLDLALSATVTTNSDSNINRQAASAAFAQAGRQEGLQIWRVEKFAPVPVPRDNYGKFHEGDSYIILNTKISRGKKSYDIHYWIGKESSQDESAGAAIMAVHLDDSLGKVPTEHRETQGNESQLFNSYFPHGIKYLKGGVSSGLHHVTPNAPSSHIKLYQVKGKKDIHVRLIEPKASAMNNGDSYILDTGKVIYAYYGSDSRKQERLKAISAANQMRDKDYSGRAKVEIIDENATPEEVADFFKALGGGSRSVLSKVNEDDETFEKNAEKSLTLHEIRIGVSGDVVYERLPAGRRLTKSSLKSEYAHILDATTTVFIWNGRKSSKNVKDVAKIYAYEILKTKNYPSWVPVITVIENGEPTTFKQYFDGWRENLDMQGLGRG